jgi:DNA-binding transcriptional LysR family regulator
VESSLACFGPDAQAAPALTRVVGPASPCQTPRIMQLRHLRYFVRIVEAGSFSRAAATIHVAQPALSQQIAELEEELGVSLLHRSTRGVRPTAAGETLFREAAAILQQMEQLPGKVSARHRGRSIWA